jgi:hypothetical protein
LKVRDTGGDAAGTGNAYRVAHLAGKDEVGAEGALGLRWEGWGVRAGEWRRGGRGHLVAFGDG